MQQNIDSWGIVFIVNSSVKQSKNI